MENQPAPGSASSWLNRRSPSPQPATSDAELARLKDRLGFYESFDQIIQENIARAGELLRNAVSVRENAEQEIASAREELEQSRLAERGNFRSLLSGLLDEVTTMQVQVERLARKVADALDEVEASLPAPELERLPTSTMPMMALGAAGAMPAPAEAEPIGTIAEAGDFAATETPPVASSGDLADAAAISGEPAAPAGEPPATPASFVTADVAMDASLDDELAPAGAENGLTHPDAIAEAVRFAEIAAESIPVEESEVEPESTDGFAEVVQAEAEGAGLIGPEGEPYAPNIDAEAAAYAEALAESAAELAAEVDPDCQPDAPAAELPVAELPADAGLVSDFAPTEQGESVADTAPMTAAVDSSLPESAAAEAVPEPMEELAADARELANESPAPSDWADVAAEPETSAIETEFAESIADIETAATQFAPEYGSDDAVGGSVLPEVETDAVEAPPEPAIPAQPAVTEPAAVPVETAPDVPGSTASVEAAPAPVPAPEPRLAEVRPFAAAPSTQPAFRRTGTGELRFPNPLPPAAPRPMAQPAAPRGSATTVLVHGVPRATTALSLKRYLEGLPHVGAVEPREYAEGVLRLQVVGQRPVQIDDLRGWPDGAGLETVHLREDLVEVRLPH